MFFFYMKFICYKEENGRMLCLKEAHELIYKKEHKLTYCHDPITGVELTRCIFNNIVDRVKPIKMYKVCR